MLHILERGIIHFFASGSLVLAVFLAYSYWTKHNAKAAEWLPSGKALLVFSALSVFALASLREPIDVALGQSVTKAFTDFTSWILGTGVSAWGLYRFKKM